MIITNYKDLNICIFSFLIRAESQRDTTDIPVGITLTVEVQTSPQQNPSGLGIIAESYCLIITYIKYTALCDH